MDKPSGKATGKAQVVGYKATTSNPNETERTAAITVEAGGTTETVTVRQNGASLNLSTYTMTLASGINTTGSFTFKNSPGLAITVSTVSDWLELTGTTTGTTTGTDQSVDIKAKTANPADAERTAKVKVKTGDIEKELTVTQSGSSLNLSTYTMTLASGINTTGSFTFKNSPGLAITVSTVSDWLELTGTTTGTTTGTDQSVDIKAKTANPADAERTAKVKVKTGDIEKELTVTQSGASLNLSTTNITGMKPEKDTNGSFTFNNAAGLAITVSTVSDWLELSGTTTGTTTGTDQSVTYKATGTNPKAATRTAVITVKTGNISKTVNVTQNASSLNTSTASLEINPEINTSGSFTFNGTKELPVTITNNSTAWLQLTGSTSGNTSGGNQTINYKATSSNPAASVRSATITVKTGDITKTVTIKQKASGFTLSINPSGALGAQVNAQGTLTMNGTNGLAYKFTGGFPSWITPTNGSASTGGGSTTGGNQQLTYKANSANPNAAARSQTVTVAAGNISKSVTISQSGSSFSAAGATTTILAAANSTATGSVTATDGVAWTISPTSHNGISVSPTSGTGSKTLTFTSDNNSTTERTGSFTVTVTGANPARSVTVTAKQMSGAFVGNLQVCKTDEARSNWSTADSNCSNSTKEGQSDWRLPSKDELITVYNNKSSLQATSGFTAFVINGYWSSMTDRSGEHWFVTFYSGGSSSSYDATNLYVRCVRNAN